MKLSRNLAEYSASDLKVIKILRASRNKVSLFPEAVHALSTIDQQRWGTFLDMAGVGEYSSYRSSMKRAAADPEDMDRKQSATGNINKTIALLATQSERTASGSTVKGGRPPKTQEQRMMEQTQKALEFLFSHYPLHQIITMAKDYAAKKS